MAHATTNTSVDGVLTTYLNKTFVPDLEFDLQHQKFTMKGDLIRGGGAVILRFNEFAPPKATGGPVTSYSGTSTTALAEGTVSENAITQIAITDNDVTVAEYGEHIVVTNLYEMAALEGTMARHKKRLKDGALATIDSSTRLWAAQTTNKLYADNTSIIGGGTSAPDAGPGRMGAALLVNATKTLYDGLSGPVEGVAGHPSGQFAAVLTPMQELQTITEVTTNRITWAQIVTNVSGALGQEKAVKGYMGSVYRTACYVTNNYMTSVTSGVAQVGFVYGDGGVGSASFDDMQATIIVNDVNSPYKNKNTLAWHAIYGGKLLRSASVVMLYSSNT